MALVEGTTLTNGAITPVLGPAALPVGVPVPVGAAGGGASGAGQAVYAAPSSQQFMDMILNSPLYKQGIETLQGGYDTALSRMDTLAALQAGFSSGGGYTPERVPQSFYDQVKLAREKAAHDYGLQQGSIPELMAARGMLSSGQTAFEQGEASYSYGMLQRDLDLQVKAREEAVAEANRARAASAASASRNAAISKQIADLQNEWKKADMAQELAQDKNKLIGDVSAFYKDLWWNGSEYVGPSF